MFLTFPDLAPFVVASFLCAGSQSVAFCFLQKCLKSCKMLFSCECCAFLNSLDVALNMACAPNATRSRCFAAGVCRFPELTLWVLLVFSIDVHHSAVKRPLPLDPWHCRCLSEAHDLNACLRWRLVIQFGWFWLPRMLQIGLLVSLIGARWPSWCNFLHHNHKHIFTFLWRCTFISYE